ncbi:MAG TPA: sulfatase-like hydrolase/transferase [Candidatus Hydrogenedentes bacterium]|nr:sulfatase-like hydrolase/transferase [Candidatus Hydrogenedentota bacterium]HPC14901.1 sulfatase-like hydrolase/transferase [Candidatus Hydrogenedentota bacterium]HRT18765.1 sulfatase-like hydrolase/transferase [Candidatus Hydrogenedentota bacterium]
MNLFPATSKAMVHWVILILAVATGKSVADSVQLNDLPVTVIKQKKEWRQGREAPAGTDIFYEAGKLGNGSVLRVGVKSKGDLAGTASLSVRVDGIVKREWTLPLGEQWKDERLELDGIGAVGAAIQFHFRSVQPFWIGPCEVVAPNPSRPNIIIYLIDTLRLDRLFVYGYERPTSPAMDAFAKESVRFTQAVPQAPSTRCSVASMLTSTYPPEQSANEAVFRPGLPRLATRLSEGGYETHGITSNAVTLPVWGYGEGFFRYYNAAWGHPYSAFREQTIARAAETLAFVRGRPWFLFVHSAGVHSPYIPPALFAKQFAPDLPASEEAVKAWLDTCPETPTEYYEMFTFGYEAGAPDPAATMRSKEEMDAMVKKRASDAYDAWVAYNDWLFSRLLDDLKKADMYDDSIIVLLSDHGEEFWEHGGIFHGNTLFEEMLRVPLLIKLPKQAHAGRVIESLVEMVDLAPTLLELAGLPPEPQFRGRSFAELITGGQGAKRVGFSYLGSQDRNIAKTTTLKCLYDPSGQPSQWYDLAADPGEQRALTMAPEGGRELEQQARWLMMLGVSGLHVHIRCSPDQAQTLAGILKSPLIHHFRYGQTHGAGRVERANDMLSFTAQIGAEALDDPEAMQLRIALPDSSPKHRADIHLWASVNADAPISLSVLKDGAPVDRESVFIGENQMHGLLDGAPFFIADAISPNDRTAWLADDFGVYVWYVPETNTADIDRHDRSDALQAMEALGYIGSDPASINECDRRNERLQRECDLYEVAKYWFDYVDQHPKAARAHYWLGAALERIEMPKRAAEAYAAAEKLAPRLPSFTMDLAEAWMRLGRYDAVAGSLQRIIALAPADPDILSRVLALTRQVAEDVAMVESAPIDVCCEALKLAAVGAETELQRGMFAEKKGDRENAVAAYSRAIEFDPNNYKAFLGLARALQKQGAKEKALEAVEKALVLVPDSADALRCKASIQEDMEPPKSDAHK